MTISDLMKDLAEFKGKSGTCNIALTEPSLFIHVGQTDAVGADIVQYCTQKYPDMTLGDLMDSIQMAWWWVTFYCSLVDEPKDDSKGDPDASRTNNS